MRKYPVSVQIALFFTLVFSASVPGMAASGKNVHFPTHVVAQCGKEAPPAQKDIEQLVGALAEINAGSGSPNMFDAEVYGRHGLSEVRGLFVLVRVVTAASLLNLPEGTSLDLGRETLLGEGLPDVLIATEEDVALVRKNDKLLATVGLGMVER